MPIGYLVWVEGLQFNPSSSSLLWWDVRLVLVVGFIESQDYVEENGSAILIGAICMLSRESSFRSLEIVRDHVKSVRV